MQLFKEQPFDDFHRYHRPAALVAQSMRGGEIGPLLDWLSPPLRPEGMTEADMNTLKAFGVKR